MKHTHGEWKAYPQINGDVIISAGNGVNTTWIATLHYEDNKTVDDSVIDEFDANARLISSAPKLEALLHKAIPYIEELINRTPTGEKRNAITDLNIEAQALLSFIENGK